MQKMIPVLGRRKEDAKPTRTLLTMLLLATCCLLLNACSAVPQSASAAATPQPESQHNRNTVLPNATVGVKYLDTLPSTGAPTTPQFSLITGTLPPGLSLNAQSGVISGVPTEAGSYAFEIRDGRGVNAFENYAIKVVAAAATVSVQVSPANVSIAAGGTVQFSASVKNTSDTAVAWSSSAGSISSTGLLKIPAVTSLKSITVTATSNADPTKHASATAAVTGTSTFTISTVSLPAGTQSVSYSATLTASGGQLPYQWNIVSGSLPTGLQLNSSTGTVSGTASVAGTFTFAVQSTDASSQTAQHTFSLAISSGGSTSGSNCGPPTYNCSRTDTNITQVPSSVPNVGGLLGANTIVTDPSFGNRIVRITDGNTAPYGPFQNRTFMTASSGSADENLWNVDSTMFVVQDTGARGYPFSFDPSTMQASRLYASALPASHGMTLPDNGAWSHSDPNMFYVITGTAVNKYDFSDRTNPPAPQLVFDFAGSPNCLPAGFNATWKSRGGLSADDSVIGMGYSNAGGQQTAVYAVAYKAGMGCTVLNTQTGQVWGNWGMTGTINIPDRWRIHNVKISKDGNWLVVATAGCLTASCSHGPYFWQIGTTNVSSCGAGGYCDGHWTEGYTHWVNNNDTPATNQVMRLFNVPNSVVPLTTYFPGGMKGTYFDQHQSWNNVDPSDSVPLFSTTYSPMSSFPAPWFDEIIALASDGSGKVWRFAHNYITAKSQDFSVQYAIGSVSQDGKFFIFSSDWMGTLGSETGTANCTVGTNCRGDVFVVELR